MFGTVLSTVRAAVGDGAAGQRPGQAVAVGVPREDRVYLSDGRLTRGELRDVVLKSAQPLGQGNTGAPFVYPLTAPHAGELNVLFEGYGAATPAAAERAVDVLLGRTQLPERPVEDEFFTFDRAVRDTLWGGYDRDGDGQTDSEALGAGLATELDLGAVDTVNDALDALSRVAAVESPEARSTLAAMGENTLDYWLHRRLAAEPGVTGCAARDNEKYMDRTNTEGDLEPCFEDRITSVAAAYRPLGIFPSTSALDAPLPAGSTVNVELYVVGETPTMVRPTGVLVATDREIGAGEGLLQPVVGSGPGGAACDTLGEACWTKYEFSFATTRPAFTGEQLTFQIQLVGTRSWAFGFEGAHAPRIQIEPAPMSPIGLEFGVTVDSRAEGSSMSESETVTAGGTYAFPDLGEDPTGAGDHPTTRRVEVSLDDKTFAQPRQAVLDAESGTWHLALGQLEPGAHAVYARTRMDTTTTSEAVRSTFTVTPDAVVQWQIVNRNGPADPGT